MSQGKNSAALPRTKARGTGPAPAEINQHARMRANASVSSCEELEPCGVRRIDHSRRPAAKLEVQGTGESRLTLPADQIRSDQRVRQNYFVQPKHPSETAPGLHSGGQQHTKEGSPGNPSPRVNEEAILETLLEDHVGITIAQHCKLPVLLPL